MANWPNSDQPAARSGWLLRPLVGERLLSAWDQSSDRGDLERPLTLLAAASPGATFEQLARLDFPARNRELLRLRWISFGPVLAGFVPCASCATRLEFTVSTPALLERLEHLDAGDKLEWTAGTVRCTLRAATTEDLLQVIAEPDHDGARQRLLDRCLAAVGGDEAVLDAIRSDPSVLDRFERLHEAAEIMCEVRCPACSAVDLVDLDIGRFLWDEVRHAALRLLRQVHDLGSAYGWSEASVVAMSHRRRLAYLDMVWA
jgi:hypothetical protein